MKDEKFLQEEKLSDEELEKVSGGTHSELAEDSRYLNVLLQGTNVRHKCDRYGTFRLIFDGAAQVDVMNAWQALGVNVELNEFGSNEYIIGGEKVSRQQAWDHAERTTGKTLKREQWDW